MTTYEIEFYTNTHMTSLQRQNLALGCLKLPLKGILGN